MNMDQMLVKMGMLSNHPGKVYSKVKKHDGEQENRKINLCYIYTVNLGELTFVLLFPGRLKVSIVKLYMYVRGLLCICGMSSKAPAAPIQSSGGGKG